MERKGSNKNCTANMGRLSSVALTALHLYVNNQDTDTGNVIERFIEEMDENTFDVKKHDVLLMHPRTDKIFWRSYEKLQELKTVHKLESIPQVINILLIHQLCRILRYGELPNWADRLTRDDVIQEKLGDDEGRTDEVGFKDGSVTEVHDGSDVIDANNSRHDVTYDTDVSDNGDITTVKNGFDDHGDITDDSDVQQENDVTPGDDVTQADDITDVIQENREEIENIDSNDVTATKVVTIGMIDKDETPTKPQYRIVRGALVETSGGCEEGEVSLPAGYRAEIAALLTGDHTYCNIREAYIQTLQQTLPGVGEYGSLGEARGMLAGVIVPGFRGDITEERAVFTRYYPGYTEKLSVTVRPDLSYTLQVHGVPIPPEHPFLTARPPRLTSHPLVTALLTDLNRTGVCVGNPDPDLQIALPGPETPEPSGLYWGRRTKSRGYREDWAGIRGCNVYTSTIRAHGCSYLSDTLRCQACRSHRHSLQHTCMVLHRRAAYQKYGTDSKEKFYPCKTCDKVLFTPKCLREHEESHAVDRPYKCDRCSNAYKSAKYLRYHKNLSHDPADDKEGMCPTCGRMFPDQRALRRHERQQHGVQHGEPAGVCSYCGKVFSREASLRQHEARHRDPTPGDRHRNPPPGGIHRNPTPGGGHRNPPPGGPRRAGPRLRRNRKPTHVTLHILHKCNTCNKLFQTQDALREHTQQFPPDKPCRPDTSLSLTTLRAHPSSPKLRQHHYMCATCNRRFYAEMTLAFHACAEGDVKFRCDVCRKGFKDYQGLVIHRAIHFPDRPYLCSGCGKGYKTHGERASHMRNMHGIGTRPHKCPHCYLRFRAQETLARHLEVRRSQGVCRVRKGQARGQHVQEHGREARGQHTPQQGRVHQQGQTPRYIDVRQRARYIEVRQPARAELQYTALEPPEREFTVQAGDTAIYTEPGTGPGTTQGQDRSARGPRVADTGEESSVPGQAGTDSYRTPGTAARGLSANPGEAAEEGEVDYISVLQGDSEEGEVTYQGYILPGQEGVRAVPTGARTPAGPVVQAQAVVPQAHTHS